MILVGQDRRVDMVTDVAGELSTDTVLRNLVVGCGAADASIAVVVRSSNIGRR